MAARQPPSSPPQRQAGSLMKAVSEMSPQELAAFVCSHSSLEAKAEFCGMVLIPRALRHPDNGASVHK